MNQATGRSAEFKAEIAAMKLKTSRVGLENALLVVGIVLMVAGVIVAFVAYSASLNVTATPGSNVDLLDSNSYLALAIAGGVITLAGGAVFVRYSLAKFLRFWLLRQIYEGRLARDEGTSN
jgi:beta-lactamase regulating signal transducer with metallopeptidase domain